VAWWQPPSVSDGAGEIDRLAFTYIDGDWLGSGAGQGSPNGTECDTQRAVLSSGIAIPVLGLLHQYDWSDASTTTSTVPDLAGDDDLTGGFTDLNATINGVQAGNFDGTADSVSGAFSSSVAQPVEIFSVAETSNNGDTQIITTGTNNNSITAKRFITTDVGYQLHAGNNLKGGSPASNDPELLTTRFDGEFASRVNGSEELSGPAGTNGMDGLVVS